MKRLDWVFLLYLLVISKPLRIIFIEYESDTNQHMFLCAFVLDING